jgi:uncharacterized protein (DUF58 family)
MDVAATGYRRFLYFAAPLLLVLGRATGASALVALAGALILGLAGAFLSSRRRLLGLRISRRMHPNAFEDEAVRVELLLENRSRRRALLVDVDDTFSASMADTQTMLEPGPLPAERGLTLAYRSFCSRGWGEHRVGPLGLSVSDPLGLYRARRVHFQLDTLTVFPRTHAVKRLEHFGARASLAPQNLTSSRPGQSLAYLGVRDYQPGDDVRRVHWPATARRGELAVKECELDLMPYFTLFLDLSRKSRAGTGRKSTLEYVVRTAVSLVWAAAQRGDVVQVIGDGAAPLLVPPGTGELHATRALYELVRVRQDGKLALLDLVEQHRIGLPAGSTAALLFGSLDVDPLRLEETLELLRVGGVRAVAFIVNDSSFLPMDKRRLAKADVDARTLTLLSALRGREVPGVVLSADVSLADELARPDLFHEPGA